MSITLLSSPLQGFTDFRFRNAFHHYFGGIDTFYAPYIKMNGKMVIKNNYQRDLNPENNQVSDWIKESKKKKRRRKNFSSKVWKNLK